MTDAREQMRNAETLLEAARLAFSESRPDAAARFTSLAQVRVELAIAETLLQLERTLVHIEGQLRTRR